MQSIPTFPTLALVLGAITLPAAASPRAAGATSGDPVAVRRTDAAASTFLVTGLRPGERGALVAGTERGPRAGGVLDVAPLRLRLFRADATGSALVPLGLPPTPATVHVQAVGGSGGGALRVSGVQSYPGPTSVVQRGDIVITEIGRAPGLVSDPLGEWFEIHNATNSAIDVEGWRIADEGGEQHVIQNGGAGVILLSGASIVMGTNDNLLTNGGLTVNYPYSGITLDDLADELLLVEPSGLVIDRVAWSSSGGGWPSVATGRALSLDGAAYDAIANDAGASWCSASTPFDILVAGADRGTPGALNPSCACTFASDVPDGSYLDSNCDGLDGDITRAVFVAVGGAPNAPGTPTAPLGSVQAAIELALVDPSRDHVYVSAGVYTELITMRNGVSIWGGFSALNSWERGPQHVTTFASATVVNGCVLGVRASNLASPIVFGDVSVTPADASGPNVHVVGIHVHAVSNLTLERVSVVSGDGADGVDGANGEGHLTSTYTGGAGGAGGSAFGGGWDGTDGNGTSGTGSGGNGGAGGGVNADGSAGANGAAGASLPHGQPGANVIFVSGTFLGISGQGASGASGVYGNGGGGGGGGGGGVFFGFPGGAGGQGGTSGRPGRGGTLGGFGGSSIALVVSSSPVHVVDCSFTAGDGGDGGTGGTGVTGLAGSAGSNGASAGGAGDGGRGGNGGAGGTGAHGSNGGGGHSHAIVLSPTATVTLQGVALSVGTPGAGGVHAPALPGLNGEQGLILQL